MNSSEIHPQQSQRANSYSFKIEGKDGVIKSAEREFRITDYLPNIYPEGQIVLAILAYSGYFNGFFYNTETHERVDSDIFTYFNNLANPVNLSNIQTGEALLNLIFETDKAKKLETFLLIDSRHLSQLFKIIRTGFNEKDEDIDIFKHINQLLLNRNNNSWQSVFDFWKEYIDMKKQFFNFCEFQCRKVFAIAKNNIFVSDFLKKQVKDIHTPVTLFTAKIYSNRINFINLTLKNVKEHAFVFLKKKVDAWLSKLDLNTAGTNIDSTIWGEVRSGISFLLFHGITGRSWNGKNLKRGIWVEPSVHNTSGLIVNGSNISLNLVQQKATIFIPLLVYYSTGYGNILSACPIRNYSLLLGSNEQ